MATPKERFVEALTFLKDLQEKNVVGIQTEDMPNPKHRQLLVKNGFIRKVTKGWYIATNPTEKVGETTAWYSSFWEFIVQFLQRKYGDNWCLSADQSLLLHAGNWVVPQQLLVRSPDGNNRPTPLPHNMSLFNLKTNIPLSDQTITEKGIRMYSLQASLIYTGSAIFTSHAIDARTALLMIRDASELLPILLEHGHTTLAGRLAGAFRNIGRDKIADQIVDTFKQADYDIREEDPFETKL